MFAVREFPLDDRALPQSSLPPHEFPFPADPLSEAWKLGPFLSQSPRILCYPISTRPVTRRAEAPGPKAAHLIVRCNNRSSLSPTTPSGVSG